MDIENGRELTDLISKVLRETWEDFSDKESRRLATEFRDKVVQYIKQQKGRGVWPPLQPAYLAYKRRAGLDTRTLIAHGHYVASWHIRPLRRGSWVAAPKPGKHPNANLTYAQLGLIHELGAMKRGIPPRPHVAPVAADFTRRKTAIEDDIARRYVGIVANEVLRRIAS